MTETAYLSLLGDRVRAWRTDQGMTRKTLAQASGVSERYLAQLEAGEGNISVLLLRKVARAMGVSVARAEKIQNQLAVVQFTPIDEETMTSFDTDDAAQMASDRQMQHRVVTRVGQLPERLRTLLSLYYCENLTYKEIGQVMGISRSRICQLHTQALDALRQGLSAEAA